MATEASRAQLESRRALEAGSSGWFPCFDGLRAIAALSVFAYHAVSATATPGWAPTIVEDWIARFGAFGVAVFFVISGFLLYRPFVLAHFRGTSAPRLGPFWLRRFARIFPGYWLALTVTILVILPATRPHSVVDTATLYGLVQNYRTGYALAGIAVAWTLVIELSFYIALPAIAWCLRAGARPSAPRATKLRTQVIGLLVIIGLATALRVWLLFISPPSTFHRGAWFALDQVSNWLPSYLDWFGVGMLLAVASAWTAVGGGIPKVLAVLGRRPWISWLLALESYWVVTQLRLPRLATRSYLVLAPAGLPRHGAAAPVRGIPRRAGSLRAAGSRVHPLGPAEHAGRLARADLLRHLPLACADVGRVRQLAPRLVAGEPPDRGAGHPRDDHWCGDAELPPCRTPGASLGPARHAPSPPTGGSGPSGSRSGSGCGAGRGRAAGARHPRERDPGAPRRPAAGGRVRVAVAVPCAPQHGGTVEPVAEHDVH